MQHACTLWWCRDAWASIVSREQPWGLGSQRQVSSNHTCLLLNHSHLLAQRFPRLPQDEITVPSTSLSSSCQENTLQMVNYANDYDIMLRLGSLENDHKYSHIRYQCRAEPTLPPAFQCTSYRPALPSSKLSILLCYSS